MIPAKLFALVILGSALLLLGRLIMFEAGALAMVLP
jgi:hypothetical protein